MLMRRSVLLAFAFASLLLIIRGAAFAIGHGAEKARQQVAELHEAHLKADGALASMRADVFLGGILTRDYLLVRAKFVEPMILLRNTQLTESFVLAYVKTVLPSGDSVTPR